MKELPSFKFCVMEGLDNSFLPTRANDTDSGWDVKAAEDVVLKPFQTALIPLGVRCFAPQNWWLELRPRSSTMAKKNLHCLYGVIDEAYENQIMLAATWIPPWKADEISTMEYLLGKTIDIKKGDRLGQLIPVPRQEMKVIEVTKEEFDKLVADRNGSRGLGGFGSSGK